MQLEKIIANISGLKIVGSTAIEVKGITADSRKVEPGYVFVAVNGTQVDGHDYIEKAISMGAVAVVVERSVEVDGVTVVHTDDSARALGWMAANLYGNPSKQFKVVAVTGTNGKTSVATMLFNLFQSLGYGVGLISTVVNRINDEEIPSTHTTPDAVQLQALLADMLDEGVDYCFMEASSHAIVQERIAGLDVDVALFTNITHDHLDYHETFKNYIAAKKKLFDDLKPEATAIYNADDKNGKVMVQNTQAEIKSFGLKRLGDYHAKILANQLIGLNLELDGKDLWVRLLGEFNASNVLAVYSVAMELGQDQEEVLTALSDLKTVPGRFDVQVGQSGVIGIVDYAHTPDAVENVLSTINDMRAGGETVFAVVGCGGDRDKTKRPEMAALAVKLADKTILTSDNPRTEDPNAILDDMMAGVPIAHVASVLSIADRKQAIKTAAVQAQKGDVVVVLGKGHEDYQEIMGVKHPFDDRIILAEMLNLIKA